MGRRRRGRKDIRKELIEFVKKSFNDDQNYSGEDIKKELDEVLKTYTIK